MIYCSLTSDVDGTFMCIAVIKYYWGLVTNSWVCMKNTPIITVLSEILWVQIKHTSNVQRF